MPSGDISERAAAKVNLTLRVGRARSDGYHPLDSLVVFADWGDTVTVRPADSLILTMSGEASRALAGERANLVLLAARQFQLSAGISEGAAIHLEKLIPVAAGLGGGSADAAATLRALNRLWQLDWSQDRLAQLALSLGADVPACVYSRPLRMRGIGDWIELLDNIPTLAGIILNPGVAVSTGEVFRAFDAALPPALSESIPQVSSLLTWLQDEPNDLQAVAIARAPVIGQALDVLAAAGKPRLVRMSGSGASCFALHDSFDAAEQACAMLRAALPGWTIQAVKFGAGGHG